MENNLNFVFVRGIHGVGGRGILLSRINNGVSEYAILVDNRKWLKPTQKQIRETLSSAGGDNWLSKIKGSDLILEWVKEVKEKKEEFKPRFTLKQITIAFKKELGRGLTEDESRFVPVFQKLNTHTDWVLSEFLTWAEGE